MVDELTEEVEPARSKSLLETLFESRVELADSALNKPQLHVFEMAIGLIHADIKDLPPNVLQGLQR